MTSTCRTCIVTSVTCSLIALVSYELCSLVVGLDSTMAMLMQLCGMRLGVSFVIGHLMSIAFTAIVPTLVALYTYNAHLADHTNIRSTLLFIARFLVITIPPLIISIYFWRYPCSMLIMVIAYISLVVCVSVFLAVSLLSLDTCMKKPRRFV